MFIREHKLLAQDEEIQRKNKEIIELTKRRDSLFLEIEEARKVKTDINKEYNEKSEKLYTIEFTLEETIKAMDSSKIDFSLLTEKQIQKIAELNNEMSKKLSEIGKYKSKILIDIDKENITRKEKIKSLNLEIEFLENKKKSLESEILESGKKINADRQNLETERRRLEELNMNLKKRENVIRIKEQRYKIINH